MLPESKTAWEGGKGWDAGQIQFDSLRLYDFLRNHLPFNSSQSLSFCRANNCAKGIIML